MLGSQLRLLSERSTGDYVEHLVFRVIVNVLAVGNLRTTDFDGPYNISLLSTQYNEIKGKPAV